MLDNLFKDMQLLICGAKCSFQMRPASHRSLKGLEIDIFFSEDKDGGNSDHMIKQKVALWVW